MSKLPRGLSGQQVRRALERAGFYLKRQRGSHMILRRDQPFAQVVVPDHRSLDTGTLSKILDGAGLSVEEFLKLLERAEPPARSFFLYNGVGETMKTQQRRRTRLDREVLLEKLRAALPTLQERYGVKSLALFGSYARGEQRRSSDLDILVEFDDRPLTLLQFIALEQELSDLLGVKVDLVERHTLKPAIGRHVVQELIPV